MRRVHLEDLHEGLTRISSKVEAERNAADYERSKKKKNKGKQIIELNKTRHPPLISLI